MNYFTSNVQRIQTSFVNVLSLQTCIVRPTKKPTNLSQSGEVPKGGRWMNFWKEVFRWKGGGEGCLGFYRFTFLSFSCFGLLLGTLKWDDFVPQNFKYPSSKRGMKNQLPSLGDH